jgi:negative regulator of sigma E activity
VSPSRTVIVGSALPILILLGLVAFPAARTAVGLEQPEAVPSDGQAGVGSEPAGLSGSGSAGAGSRAAQADEAVSLRLLHRSISAGRSLPFTGTEIISAWRPGGSTTRVLDLVQRAGGLRTATARDTTTGEQQLTGVGTVGDGLDGLSERALDALAAGYELRTAGADRVAGRAATVVVAARDGREVARMWLDDRTGLLLRQDVRDRTGRMHRTAAFVDLQVTAPVPGPVTPVGSAVRVLGLGNRFGRTDTAAGRRSAPDPWDHELSSAELTALRSAGWPCPAGLPAGFALLDARRATDRSGRPAVHLTYGDGLSAISLFLQRGELDGDAVAGLSSRRWGDTEVYVRDGWPEVMIWQGGPTVITAVGDAEPSELRSVLSTLPRQSNHGTLDSLQQRMGSALAWFTR